MNFANDPAGWVQVILEAIAIVLVLAFYFLDYRRGKQKAMEERKREQKSQRTLKRAILSALKQELEMNWRLLHDPPLLEPKVYHSRYYNPTYQIFKYPDDAIGLALSTVESDVLLNPDLAQGLLAVRQAVRFVNQQVEELMAFRFGSPDKLARATTVLRNDPKCLVRFASNPKTIPNWGRAWFQELALRHWAIVNEGYWYRLVPSLVSVQPHVDVALQEVGLPPLEMPVPEAGFEIYEIGEAPPLSAWGGVESSGSTFRGPSEVLFIEEAEEPGNETSD